MRLIRLTLHTKRNHKKFRGLESTIEPTLIKLFESWGWALQSLDMRPTSIAVTIKPLQIVLVLAIAEDDPKIVANEIAITLAEDLLKKHPKLLGRQRWRPQGLWLFNLVMIESIK